MGAVNNESSIGEIAQDPMKGGADAAYKKLRADVVGIDPYDSAEAHNRMEQATADMEQKGVLPQVSAAWLKNEFSRIDADGNGLIERRELEQAEQERTRYGAFDAKFAGTVDKELFDKISSYDQRIGENNISKGDLNRYLRRDDRANRKDIEKEEAKDALAPLFEGPDPLINYLNKDGNRRVSRHEMKEFLEDYKQFQGQYPYTEANAKFVEDLLHRDIPELDTGITTGFSAKHSAKEMGLDSAHGRKHKDFSLASEEYEKERPIRYDQPQPEPESHGTGNPSGDGTPPPGDKGVQEPEKVICPPPIESYTVKKGDCVWNIAKDKLNDHHEHVKNREIKRYVRDITDMNGLDKHGRTPDLIYPGESLFIPPIFDEHTAARISATVARAEADARRAEAEAEARARRAEAEARRDQFYGVPQEFQWQQY